MNPLPKRPAGNSDEARFMQWVWDTLRSLRTQDVPNARVLRTTRGVAIVPKPQATQGSGSGDPVWLP